MTGREYQEKAARTINKDLTLLGQRNHALHGMVGELGEIHSLFQKEYQGHGAPDREHLLKECGDLLWFLAEFLSAQGFSLEDCMEQNIKKLEKRFPVGFETEKSVNRKEGDI